jgi:excisionase family DNA binding protein
MPSDRIFREPELSRCPLRDRQGHTLKSPDLLTPSALQQIKHQIHLGTARPLPALDIGQRFYRCNDCFAVWAAGTRYERVSETNVYGIYDHSLIWKPWTPNRKNKPKRTKNRLITLPMTANELAACLRIHVSTVYRMVKSAQVPYLRIGGNYRFSREAIDEWMKNPGRSKCGTRAGSVGEL